MNITRKIEYLILIHFCLGLSGLNGVERAEMHADFTPAEYKRDSNPVYSLPEVDPKADIPELFNRNYAFSEQVKADSTMQEINGFRIQIFRTEDLEEAKRRESIYITSYGEENVTLIFETPFYKIRVGRFRDKEEAEEFQQTLKWRGISGTIIVPDRVKVLMPVK